jgi:hypothetical protein
MKSAATTTVRTKENLKRKYDGRKCCPKGYSCPYRNEYQHNLEFSHYSETIGTEKKTESQSIFIGKGRKLGTDRRSDSANRTVFLNRVETSNQNLPRSSASNSNAISLTSSTNAEKAQDSSKKKLKKMDVIDLTS